MAAAGFLSHYLSGPLPYVRRLSVDVFVLPLNAESKFEDNTPTFGGTVLKAGVGWEWERVISDC